MYYYYDHYTRPNLLPEATRQIIIAEAVGNAMKNVDTELTRDEFDKICETLDFFSKNEDVNIFRVISHLFPNYLHDEFEEPDDIKIYVRTILHDPEALYRNLTAENF